MLPLSLRRRRSQSATHPLPVLPRAPVSRAALAKRRLTVVWQAEAAQRSVRARPERTRDALQDARVESPRQRCTSQFACGSRILAVARWKGTHTVAVMSQAQLGMVSLCLHRIFVTPFSYQLQFPGDFIF